MHVVPGFVDDAFCVKVGFSFAVAVEAASYHRVPPCTKREREREREREKERERQRSGSGAYRVSSPPNLSTKNLLSVKDCL